MSGYDYDLLVIGAGSGGVRASRTAARLGAKVAVVEERYLGGTCVNVGCVPKKLFVYSSHYRDALLMAPGYGWNIEHPTFDWQTLRENKDKEIARLNQVYRQSLIDDGVHLFESKASIMNPHRIKIGDTEYTAERILVATGGWPHVPEFPGKEHVITSNEAFQFDKLPNKLMIVGGGYIGVEFAGMFNGLGVEVHLCYRGGPILRGFDYDVRHFLTTEMTKKGVIMHFNTDIECIEKNADNDLRVYATDGRQWQMEQVLFATGRRPKTDGLGLENTAVVVDDDGYIEVNDLFQTAEPSMYALGDVVGHMALTPVALAEGIILAHNLFGNQQRTLDYPSIPTAIFCQPPVAAVGLTEAKAREIYDDIDIYKATFKPLQFSLSNSDEKTLVKLVVDRNSDKVLGCHMVGSDSAEIMQGLAIALTAGATKKDFDNTIGIHPTLAEEFVSLRQPVQ